MYQQILHPTFLPYVLRYFPVCTSRLSSSSQFWTRISSVTGRGFLSSIFATRNRRPSGEMSQVRVSHQNIPTVSDHGVHEQGLGAWIGDPDHVHSRAVFKWIDRQGGRRDAKAGRRRSKSYPFMALIALGILPRKPAFKTKVHLSFASWNIISRQARFIITMGCQSRRLRGNYQIRKRARKSGENGDIRDGVG